MDKVAYEFEVVPVSGRYMVLVVRATNGLPKIEVGMGADEARDLYDKLHEWLASR